MSSIKIKILLKRIVYKFRLVRVFLIDYAIYRKYSFAISNKKDQTSMEAKITLHYHSIEKGLSSQNFRYYFGKRALSELTLAMDSYVKNKHDCNSPRFMSATRVIENYIKKHIDYKKSDKTIINNLETKLAIYKNYIIKNGGSYEYKDQVKFINDNVDNNAQNILMNRNSIRDYQDKLVDFEIITKVIKIAQKTPSVCNRQPWNIYYLAQPTMIEEILTLQRGLNKDRISQIKNLFVVTIDMRYFANGYERHEPFIAAGMYTMSILTLLESFNIGSCALNTSFSNKISNQMKSIMNLKKSEVITNIITFGYKTHETLVPSSDRDPISKVLKVL